jgi:putative ABC transport system substrate-binding protein
MKRREFITLVGGATAWPLAAEAQQSAIPVIGFLNTRGPGQDPHLLSAFRQGLKEIGFVEGQNVTIQFRWAEGQYDRQPALAADLVRRRVSVIAALSGSSSALAAKEATSTIPIVFAVADNPVATGLVVSLARPGGNLTGVTTLGLEVSPKRLELLHELVPAAKSIALLQDPNGIASETYLRNLQAAAHTLGRQLHVIQASDDRDIAAAFASFAQLRPGALVIGNSTIFSSRIQQLAALAISHSLPSAYTREFAAAGGLIGYGANLGDLYRLAGTYTGRVLKGEKPADLPVQQSTKLELTINLKTAHALGVTVPPTLHALATEVIE